MELTEDQKFLMWIEENNFWVLRRVPNTKDEYYIAAGNPPAHVREIYKV